MKEAGLTHGGFYAHFDSRDALLVEALARAGRESAAAVARAAEAKAVKGISAFRSLVETYLADRHLASTETGCPVAALVCEMPRQSPALREASAQRVERLIVAVRDTLPGAPRSTASVVAGTLVGSLQLARARRLRRRPRGARRRPQIADPAVRNARGGFALIPMSVRAVASIIRPKI
jgi:AcrR family transcriptional regulator